VVLNVDILKTFFSHLLVLGRGGEERIGVDRRAEEKVGEGKVDLHFIKSKDGVLKAPA
jgi:hypothetical protein